MKPRGMSEADIERLGTVGPSVAEGIAKLQTASARELSVTVPLRLPSLSNVRMNRWKLSKLKINQKFMVYGFLMGKALPALPATVTLTRIGKKLLDDDNLQGACKYVRDQIAGGYGIDDGSPLYRWKYEQEKGKEYAVRIDIQSLEGVPL
jgi:hypothetical protein